MKKIGIYSGSFNPIHIGHLALANWICEYADIDEVWFLVSPQNPFKRFQNLMEDRLRFQMVQAAINGFPKFKASDFDAKYSDMLNIFLSSSKRTSESASEMVSSELLC